MLSYSRRLACALIAGVLAACGGGGSSSTPPPVTSVTPPPPSTAPVLPLPAGAWTAPASQLPTNGNYVYTESDRFDAFDYDYIGQGKAYLYTEQNALLSVTASDSTIRVVVEGDESWSGDISLPQTLGGLKTGLFTELEGNTRDQNKGRVHWGGEGRGCTAVGGWFSIDKLTLVDGVVTELDLRFEQRCTSRAAATRARVHWTLANANAVAPARPLPIPEGLWRAGASSVPSSGSYVYVSGAKDANGVARERLYTLSNAIMWLNGFEGRVDLSVRGDQYWTGNFAGMRALKQVQVGYYPNLKPYMRHNPLFGGISWFGDEGKGCGRTGWFAVDSVTYSGDTITALDLRFEQACDDGRPQRGQIHWVAGETPIVVGPAPTPPAGLWQRPDSFQPPAGNYVYLVGNSTNLQAPFSKTLSIDNLYPTMLTMTSELIDIRAGEYRIAFRGIEGMSKLTPGYYAGLYESHKINATKGGFEITPQPYCFESESWVLVEEVSYAQNELVSLKLRFEVNCSPQTTRLNGVVHWTKPR